MRKLGAWIAGFLLFSVGYMVVSDGIGASSSVEPVIGLLSGAGGSLISWGVGRAKAVPIKVPWVILSSSLLGLVLGPVVIAVRALPSHTVASWMAIGMGTGIGFGLVFGWLVYGIRRPLDDSRTLRGREMDLEIDEERR